MSLAGDTIGRYKLLEPVGSGGMAIVYRGLDERLGRSVAIKLLADNLAADESFRLRFLREARLSARLQHPNVAQVYDVGEAAGRPFIVMEYVEGGTLADLLARRSRLEPQRALETAIQACNGLEHAHRAGLVHRDVKPRNLLLRRDGTVKVADFGIARSTSDTRLTGTGSILGTAAYLAPEQAAGGEVTPAADVYSLGVVLYEMLAGSTPRGGETLASHLPAGVEQPLPSLRSEVPGVTAQLEEVVTRCLARRPEHRPATAGALAELLAEAAAPAAAPSVRAYRSGLRRGRVAAALALSALAAAAAMVALDAADDEPAPVGPPAAKPRPAAEQARDLSRWVREQTR